jgi:hypothetical protein
MRFSKSCDYNAAAMPGDALHQDASADPAGSYLTDNRADIEATRSGSGSSRSAANSAPMIVPPHRHR